MKMTYQREIPRDLFNEAKLLKSLGQLSLLIHDGKAPPELKCESTGDAFTINQRPEDGGLFVEHGLSFAIGHINLELYTSYNSVEPYTLLCGTKDGEIIVLNSDGSLSTEFLNFIQEIHFPKRKHCEI